jgi:hypothetical protein
MPRHGARISDNDVGSAAIGIAQKCSPAAGTDSPAAVLLPRIFASLNAAVLPMRLRMQRQVTRRRPSSSLSWIRSRGRSAEDRNRPVRALAIAFICGRKNRDKCFGGGILHRAGGRGPALGRDRNRSTTV